MQSGRSTQQILPNNYLFFMYHYLIFGQDFRLSLQYDDEEAVCAGAKY